MGATLAYRFASMDLLTAIAVGTICLAPPLCAAEQTRALLSSRFAGRGDTYVAANDSDEATRANPATISEGNVRFQLRWLQLDVFAGRNTVDTVQDIMKVDADASALSLLKTAEDKFGKRQYARVQASPVSVRILNFEISPYFSSTNFLDFHVPTTPEIEMNSDTAVGATIAYSMAFGKDWNFGLALRPMERTVYSGNIAFADVIDFVGNSDLQLSDIIDKKEGLQLGWNAGAIWRPAKPWRFGLTVENLGYAGGIGQVDDPPPPMPMRVSLGLDYRYDLKPWVLDVLVDAQDLLNPHGYQPLRLLHLGTEIGRSWVSRDTDLGALLGINEGYFTTGAYVDLFLARLTFTYYAVELGDYPGQRSDRRYAITLQASTTF